MRRWATLAAAVAVVVAVVPAAASSPSRDTKVRKFRFLVIAKVLDGSQTLSRMPYPSSAYTLSGTEHSRWIARWNVTIIDDPRVPITPIYSHVVYAHDLSGFADGSFSGSYPRGTGAASYSCSWSNVTPKMVASKVRLYVTGPQKKRVNLIFGAMAEPSPLPNATCTGDPVDPRVSTTLSDGIFAGFEESCTGTMSFPVSQLTHRLIQITKRFSWTASSSFGGSRPCNGFGAPVLSSATGTYQFRLRRL